MIPLVPLIALLSSPADAGTVVVETTLATEIVLDGLPVVRTYGPGTVSLPDVEPGPRIFVVYRNGNPTRIEVEVPKDGKVRLMVGKDSLNSDRPPEPAPDEEGPAPVLEVRGAKGQRFSVIIDGKRAAVLGPDQPLRLETLGPGPHTVELRSPDNLTIWARGTVTLRQGDEIALGITEGRPVEVFGRADAWQSSQ